MHVAGCGRAFEGAGPRHAEGRNHIRLYVLRHHRIEPSPGWHQPAGSV